MSNNPWFISVSNGHGIRVQNRMGGYYMKGGSYQQEKSAFINLNDMDLYTLLKRTDSFIRNWEMVNAYQTILQGQQTYAQYLSSIRQQGQQHQAAPSAYPQGDSGYTRDMYGQQPSSNSGQNQYPNQQYQYNNYPTY